MLNILFVFLHIAPILFTGGFIYAIVAGNQKMHWFLRGLMGGFFFTTFFVSIPILIILDNLPMKDEIKHVKKK